MICLFTDFGLHDPYVGQMHRAIRTVSPDIPIVDLFHNLPEFNIRSAAYLAAHYCPPGTGNIYCCVVDPGVGGSRAAVIIEMENSLYVGPDNGVFEILMRRFAIGSVRRINWRPSVLSSSFHGRDLFAPVAARLFLGQTVETSDFLPARFPQWPDTAAEILYIDHYGNAITGIEAGACADDHVFNINGTSIARANTFSDVPAQQPFWYQNANGLIEFAVNQESAARMLNLQIGSPVLLDQR